MLELIESIIIFVQINHIDKKLCRIVFMKSFLKSTQKQNIEINNKFQTSIFPKRCEKHHLSWFLLKTILRIER